LIAGFYDTSRFFGSNWRKATTCPHPALRACSAVGYLSNSARRRVRVLKPTQRTSKNNPGQPGVQGTRI